MDQRRAYRIHTSIAFSEDDITLTGIEASDFTGNVRSFFSFKYIGGREQDLNWLMSPASSAFWDLNYMKLFKIT